MARKNDTEIYSTHNEGKSVIAEDSLEPKGTKFISI